jgi:hypothetical protein
MKKSPYTQRTATAAARIDKRNLLKYPRWRELTTNMRAHRVPVIISAEKIK